MEKPAVPLPEEWGRMAYRRFLEREQLPLLSGLAVGDLKRVEVKPWPRMDARGAYIQLTGAEDTDGAYVLEIPSGSSTAPEQHVFEEVFFVIGGGGGARRMVRGRGPRPRRCGDRSRLVRSLQTLPPPHHQPGGEAAAPPRAAAPAPAS